MAAQEGKYYLICNYDKYDDISNYRVDRIKDLEILDEPAKPFESLPWAHGRSLDLAAYMREHPYMYSSENVRAKLKIVPAMVSDAIDMFGKKGAAGTGERRCDRHPHRQRDGPQAIRQELRPRCGGARTTNLA